MARSPRRWAHLIRWAATHWHSSRQISTVTESSTLLLPTPSMERCRSCSSSRYPDDRIQECAEYSATSSQLFFDLKQFVQTGRAQTELIERETSPLHSQSDCER